MPKGVFYGVSVGPGDPGYMTLQAVEIIRSCQNIAAPRTKQGGMAALRIAAKAVDLSGKNILPLDFSMSSDPATRSASHQASARKVKQYLDQGEAVAMLNLGDVSIYASFQYLATSLRAGGYPVKMSAGVTSFCAAAAELGTSLTEIDKPLHIIPAGYEGYEGSGTKVWMKAGRSLGSLLTQMQAQGRIHNASMVQNCGMENQRVFHRLEGVSPPHDYFSIVIEKEEPPWFGL